MSPREYDTPVRDARKARTRRTILEALSEVVTEEGIAALSVQQIADRAGISHRTVYRHFADRQALLDAIQQWVQERLQSGLAGGETDTIDALLAAVPWIFEQFDDMGAPAAAMARISVAENQRSSDHIDRTERFRDLLQPELAPLHDDPEAMFAVLRHLLSALTWWIGRAEFDLDGRRTGHAVATIIRAALARPPTPAADGTVPTAPTRESSNAENPRNRGDIGGSG